jgi:hypothetical protein
MNTLRAEVLMSPQPKAPVAKRAALELDNGRLKLSDRCCDNFRRSAN